MNLNLTDIENIYETAKKDFRSHQTWLRFFHEEQYNQEKSIIKNKKVNRYKIVHLLPMIDEIKTKTLLKIVKEQFYNPDAMEFLLLFSEAIIYGVPFDTRYFRKIRYWIQNIQKLQPGAYGNVFSSNIRGSRKKGKIFLLKFGESVNKFIIYHEYFVGSVALNQLRKKIPNFALVLGYITCSPPNPKIDSSFCRDYYGRPCVIYEYIYPSTPVSKYIRKCSFSNYMNIFLQILLSLRYASDLYGFTHHDLHTRNVLVREIQRKVSIPYLVKPEANTQKKYINTDILGIIIDYGISRIKISEFPFGVLERNTYDNEFNYPIGDIFMFLVESMTVLSRYKNEECLEGCMKILKFFMKTDGLPKDFLDIIEKNNFVIPFFEEFEGVQGLDKFFSWILKNFDVGDILTDSPLHQTIECHQGCMTINEILKNTRTKLGIKKNIFYYYDLLNYLPNLNMNIPEEVLRINVRKYEFMYERIYEQLIKNAPDEFKKYEDYYYWFMNMYFSVQDILDLQRAILFVSRYASEARETSEASEARGTSSRAEREIKLKDTKIFKEEINYHLKTFEEEKWKILKEDMSSSLKKFLLPAPMIDV